ncbi:hypothetical protein B0G74_9129 [Paraburkholderia sp. BL9I2N2]|nr:hypothetical protein B0G74_9129 [Paraburkholderia sp. BL9I2N2]
MHIFEREVNGHRYRIAAQSVWDAERGRSVARQVVLGPAEPPPLADLRATHTVGTRGSAMSGLDLGGRATGSGGAHRSGMRRGWREGRPIGRRVGCGSGDSAGVRARTQARAGGISGCESAALVVFAGIRVQRAGISSRRAAGDRASIGAGAGSGRESCRCPVRAFRGRARVRHDELRYAHRHADAGRAGPAWTRQEQEKGPPGGRAWRPGQRDGACAAEVRRKKWTPTFRKIEEWRHT